MHRMGLVLLWVLLALAGRGQVLGGFFSQNATREKDDEQQISALQVFLTVASKGYKIVESGVMTVKEIKAGEFDSHNAFYSSLSAVNPSVANMGQVAEIIALQVATVERVKAALGRYSSGGALGAGEWAVVNTALQNILAAGIADVGTLAQVLSPGTFQMTDDQRMGRIQQLDQEARDRYAQAAGFTDQTDLLVLQRQAEGSDVGTLRVIYGLE